MMADAVKLKDAPLFSGLTEAEILRFLDESGAIRQTYAKGESVCTAGDEARNLGLIMCGQVVSKSFARSGHSLTLRVYDPYDLIGLDTLYSRKKTFPRDIVAQRSSSVLWVPFLRVKDADKTESRLRNLLTENMDALIAEELIRSDYKSEVLASNRVTQRLLVHLEIVAAKHATHEVKINMTQSELAEYLCVSRSALTRAIAELRKQGKVETDGRTIRMIRGDTK